MKTFTRTTLLLTALGLGLTFAAPAEAGCGGRGGFRGGFGGGFGGGFRGHCAPGYGLPKFPAQPVHPGGGFNVPAPAAPGQAFPPGQGFPAGQGFPPGQGFQAGQGVPGGPAGQQQIPAGVPQQGFGQAGGPQPAPNVPPQQGIAQPGPTAGQPGPQNAPPQNVPPQNVPPQNVPPQNVPPQAGPTGPSGALGELGRVAQEAPVTAPAQPLPAQPAPAAPQAAVPPTAAPQVGTWTAQPAEGLVLELTLQGDGRFSWNVSGRGRNESFAGTWTLDGQNLVLARQDGEQLQATVAFDSQNSFVLRLNGGSNDSRAVNFTRRV